ncbi:hypothetical protein [Tenacibaculum soleae]|uniref:hypothetical protein n=1 Tax=Tenacibaculum soleae TaxID=447689 RepID=UPI0026E13005|nr:hypothetical protein [Tenacibaculum soleae]MDO6813787.1 hypothetical protein [Tenacibaculum soleae]
MIDDKNIKERILEFAKTQERFKRDFFNKTGLKYSNYTGINKNTDVSAKSLAIILKHYPNANINWIITGKNSL